VEHPAPYTMVPEVAYPAQAEHTAPQTMGTTGETLSLLSNAYRSSFPGDKAAGREADHLPLTSDETQNGGAVPPVPLYTRIQGIVKVR
jgi:hypothetical protein